MKKQNNSSDDDVTFSELLGSTLAVAQHGIDLASKGLFQRLKEGAKKPAKTPVNKWIRYSLDFTRGFVGFIGKTGDSYMETYEQLKKGKKE